MPYIEFKTNTSLTKEKQISLKSKLADALSSSFPGKSENWLMISFSPDTSMFFGGSDKPCVMIDISIFGNQSKKSYDKMTAEVCSLVEKECSIPADRVYVKYSEYDKWGFDGSNF
ncbi:MAG: phenylpyruvate tautomerase MIF-related protein [Eubacteriales bacterium]